MMKLKMKRKYLQLGAAMTVGAMVSSSSAYAGGGGGTNFNTISQNLVNGISNLPGLLSAMAYMFGVLLGVLGVMKIKDHVENPGNTPLKDGAIRLAAGGALFALPIIYDAMFNTVDGGAGGVTTSAKLQTVQMGI